jgi:curved DNA-binding protein CbpA
MTCYEILGVIPPVSIDELKSAYRKAAALHHPDRGGSHQTMVAIDEAYEQAKWELERGIRNNSQYPQPKPQPQPQPIPKPKPEPQSRQRKHTTPEAIALFWETYIDRLLDEAEVHGYKSSVVIFWLHECRFPPDPEAWDYLGRILNCKKGWGWHQSKKWRFDREK